MPLLSKICPVCGYVAEGGDEENMGVNQLVGTLERILHAMKSLPAPSFGKGMAQLSVIIYPILAVAFLLMAAISEAGFFWIFCLLFVVLSIVSFIRKSKGTLGNEPFNRAFREMKNDYTYFERLARRDFGKSREVTALADEITEQIRSIEKQRRSAATKNLIVWLCLMAVILGVAGYGVILTGEAVGDPVIGSVEEAAWQQAVQAYEAIPDKESMDAIDARTAITGSIVAAGETAAAEDFFIRQCMGNMKDFECARILVAYYVANGKTDAADAFVARCTAMRYPSDQTKLKKLITQ
jgi:hypothetical protein